MPVISAVLVNEACFCESHVLWLVNGPRHPLG